MGQHTNTPRNLWRSKVGRKSSQQFLTEIATDPEKLGKFILDPEGAMNEAKIGKQDRGHVKNAIAHFVHEKLVKPPDAFFIL